MRKSALARFEYVEVPRDQINLAAYNPRVMDVYASDALRARLKENGLVEPLVWNRRTQRLIGGHQRIQQMDVVEMETSGNLNYLVPVASVDVDEVEERTLNVMLNNPSIQGRWDLQALEAMFRDDGVSPFAAGFDVLDLQLMFPVDVVADFAETYLPLEATPEATPQAPAAPAERARAMAQTPLAGAVPEPTVEALDEQIAAIKDARARHRQTSREDLRSDHIVVVVFDSMDAATHFLSALKLDTDQSFVLADRFCAAIGRPDLVAPPQEE